jgi:hypothetical protein
MWTSTNGVGGGGGGPGKELTVGLGGLEAGGSLTLPGWDPFKAFLCAPLSSSVAALGYYAHMPRAGRAWESNLVRDHSVWA